MMVFERDPEDLGPEHPDDLDARMRTMEAIHEYVRGANGRCTEILYRRDGSEYQCNADKWSVLHEDEDAYRREMHDHGGGDCMCFEFSEDDYR